MFWSVYDENRNEVGGLVMGRKLVAYFSASGVTAKVAELLSETMGADLFVIEPEIPYTEADLNWMNKESRSSVEMNNPLSRPNIARKRDNMDEYDTIFIGFLESYDLTGKTIIPFATSGGSGMGKTNEKLLPSCKGAVLIEGKILKPNIGVGELMNWVNGLNV